ncbi:MAG: hypothetical protein IJI05_05830 [Erysipelotrichaceae bacterium]|nr:hypothetical protein [Erysipelotrichaceae bacterium]
MEGLFDIHTHIIPGFDDGSGSLEETEAMLKKEYEDGVRTVFATSHYRHDMFENSLEAYNEGFEEVKEIGEHIGIKVLRGCEFHASMDMIEILNGHERDTYEGTNCVLVEFSSMAARQFIRERCYALLSGGYIPIIAHFERCEACRNFQFTEELIEMGAFMQMNSQSLLGDDGFLLRRFCRKAIKEGVVHFIASDCHNTSDRAPTLGRAVRYMEKTFGKDITRRLLAENAEKLFGINGIY